MSTVDMIPVDMTVVRRILHVDPTWAAYAIADLQPAFAPYCQWTIGQSGAGEGLILLFTALDPPILICVGPAAAVGNALAQARLPDQIFISAREEHYPALTEFYDFADRIQSIWRMTPADASPATIPTLPGLVRLTVDDSPRLETLYSHGGDFAPDYFDPYQLRDGIYFGVADEKAELVAAGGTHIVDHQAGIAAIGNIYTRPDQRNQGYAGAVFQAIVATLQGENFTNIILNVNQRNITARKVYERYGFKVYCPFLEGHGSKRST